MSFSSSAASSSSSSSFSSSSSSSPSLSSVQFLRGSTLFFLEMNCAFVRFFGRVATFRLQGLTKQCGKAPSASGFYMITDVDACDTAHGGGTNTGRQSTLKVDSGKQFSRRVGVLNLRTCIIIVSVYLHCILRHFLPFAQSSPSVLEEPVPLAADEH